VTGRGPVCLVRSAERNIFPYCGTNRGLSRPDEVVFDAPPGAPPIAFLEIPMFGGGTRY